MARRKLIAANWKMYKGLAEARDFVSVFLPLIQGHARAEVVICPAFVCIPGLAEVLRDSAVGVGAQDLFWEKEGAYTGEVSAPMLREAGCSHVIIGHSERRQYFGETDATVNRKLKSALAAGLIPIVCVGEVLSERETGRTNEVLKRQCSAAFQGLTSTQAGSFTVAYEPVWAIGTGKTATPAMAAEAHAFIRKLATQMWGERPANDLRILYGGSVKPENARSLLSMEQIDGALVGGASLDPSSFAAIVKYESPASSARNLL